VKRQNGAWSLVSVACSFDAMVVAIDFRCYHAAWFVAAYSGF
jgi:hypothetical protein